MLCLIDIPVKKFHKYFAVDRADLSAFICSSLDKLSSSFSHAALWYISAFLWTSKNSKPSFEVTP